MLITGFDVLLLLGLQRFGMRTIEAIVLVLVATISACYFIEIFVLPHVRPNFVEMGRALASPLPTFHNKEMIYVAIGIIGATVMPHNLYLHSSAGTNSASWPRTTIRSGSRDPVQHDQIRPWR